MKKYVLIKNFIELKNYNDICEGCTLNQPDQEPERLMSFTDENEALAALKKFTSKITPMSGYYLFTEYYIEEGEYDEDDEWIAGGDVLEFSKIFVDSHQIIGSSIKFDSIITKAMAKHFEGITPEVIHEKTI